MADFRVRLHLRDAPPPSSALEGLVVTSAAPLSEGARAEAARKAWYWPEAEAALGSLEHALELALAEAPADPLEHAIALTRRAATLAARLDAAACEWTETGLTHAAASFVDQASDAGVDDPPLYLWLEFEARSNDARETSLLTRGLASFGRREVEVAESRRSLEEILECVSDAALYELTSSTPVTDGETLELTRGKVRVRIMPSLRNDGRRALRLRLP